MGNTTLINFQWVLDGCDSILLMQGFLEVLRANLTQMAAPRFKRLPYRGSLARIQGFWDHRMPVLYYFIHYLFDLNDAKHLLYVFGAYFVP